MNIDGLNLNKCTGDPVSCTVARECRLAGVFYSIVEIEDPEMQEDRDFYSDFARKCEDGTCPGQKKALFIDALQLMLDSVKNTDL